MKRYDRRNSRGTALLAVLWLTAALSAIAFSVASTVRAESERAITYQESTRAYYLARGAVERTLYMLKNDENGSGGTPAERFASRRRMYFREQTGDTLVELVSERGKLPLQTLNPVLLQRLVATLGGASVVSMPENSTLGSTFTPSFASMENVEELLLVPGITPELVFGQYSRLPDGNLVNRGGLIDLVSPHLKEGSSGIDPLSVHPSLLIAMGMGTGAANSFTQSRKGAFNPNLSTGGAGVSMSSNLGDVFQIRATGRPRMANGLLSETRRTVSLLIKFIPPNPRYMWISPWTHLRWYDQAFSDVASSNVVWQGGMQGTPQ